MDMTEATKAMNKDIADLFLSCGALPPNNIYLTANWTNAGIPEGLIFNVIDGVLKKRQAENNSMPASIFYFDWAVKKAFEQSKTMASKAKSGAIKKDAMYKYYKMAETRDALFAPFRFMEDVKERERQWYIAQKKAGYENIGISWGILGIPEDERQDWLGAVC